MTSRSRIQVKVKRSRKIAETAESRLEVLALQGDITPQRVQKDRTGWDYLLELPVPIFAESRTLGDRFSIPPSPLIAGICFVQVKATDRCTSDAKNNSISVKLSNWESLIAKLIPSFFVVFEFDEKPDPQRAFLVHIDEDYIRRFLEKRQEARSKGRSDLHRIKMGFKYGPAHAISPMNGESLLKSILTYFEREGIANYVKRRQEFLNTSGYESGSGIVKFTLDPRAADGVTIEECLTDIRLWRKKVTRRGENEHNSLSFWNL